MTPEELKARIFDLAKRNVILNQELAAAHRNNESLRAQLVDRPSRRQYQTIADELERVRREYAASLARNRRVHGGH